MSIPSRGHRTAPRLGRARSRLLYHSSGVANSPRQALEQLYQNSKKAEEEGEVTPNPLGADDGED